MSSDVRDRASSSPRAAGDDARRVVVIGGGIAGLATAALLASRGHEVDLLEKNDDLGGRVGTLERDGFRFDTGASWYLMPEVFEHFFSLLGTSAAEELDLAPLAPSYRVFFESHPGEPVDVHPDRARNRALFESLEPGAGERFDAYLESADQTYELALRRFLYNNLEAPTTLLRPDVLLGSPRLGRLLVRSLQDHVATRFTDERIRQILGYPAVFLGSSPERAPSMYHLMSRLDLGGPVLYPQGGFTRLIEAVAGLAVRHGALLHTRASATRILTDEGGRGRRSRVTGVLAETADGARVFPADVVVGAADLHHVETALLPRALQTHPEETWERRSPGPGAVLALLGVEGRLPQLPHHSLFFTSDWKQNFGDIFGPDARVPDPASIYVCKPSASDPSVAPDGCENLFVLVPVPADVSIGRGGPDRQGSEAVERAADAAIAQTAAWSGAHDLADRIRVRHTIGPQDFADRYHSWRGGALGLEHTLRQSAFFRPANVSAKVDGLLYAGASTVPGVGLPMCLISAELVLKRLTGDRSATMSR